MRMWLYTSVNDFNNEGMSKKLKLFLKAVVK